MMLIPEQNLTPPYSVIIAEASHFHIKQTTDRIFKDVYRQIVKETRAIDPEKLNLPKIDRFDNEIIIGLDEALNVKENLADRSDRAPDCAKCRVFEGGEQGMKSLLTV